MDCFVASAPRNDVDGSGVLSSPGYDRATQYSRDVRVQPRSRGVLDRPVKPGDDNLCCGGRTVEPASFWSDRLCAQ
jgi:hypothetical protein